MPKWLGGNERIRIKDTSPTQPKIKDISPTQPKICPRMAVVALGAEIIPSYIKKSIKNMKTSGLEYDIVREACKLSNLKIISPGYIGDATAHFLIPQHKIAIHIITDKANLDKRKLLFEKAGWKFFSFKPMTIINLNAIQLSTQLNEFIKKLEENNNAKS